MLRNYMAAAIRNLWRNRFYSAVNIAGLALGFTASLLIALYVHEEMTFDRFWPHYEQAYLVSMTTQSKGNAPFMVDAVPAQVIGLLKRRLPAGVVVARVLADSHVVSRAQQESNELISWADPQLFSVLRPAVVAGDLDRALACADGLVLTQHVARKYFGDASPLGQVLTIDHQHPLTVRAVVRDIPTGSFFSADLFGSAQASFAGLGALDLALQDPQRQALPMPEAYMRLPPSFSHRQAEAALQASADEALRLTSGGQAPDPDTHTAMKLLPVSAVHLSPQPLFSRPRGDPSLLAALALIGMAILAMAGVNFVNLMTARATRRATEIGVRKAQGATNRDLIVQFIGESLLYSVLAMLAALAAVELLLPAFSGFLHRDIVLSYGTDLAACAAVALLTGTIAGFYPALVLARFRPAAVLRGVVKGNSGGRVRQTLVMLQIAVLIGLTLATLAVQRQVQFALNEGLRFDKQQLLMIFNSCKGAFPDEVRKLAGVRAAACSNWIASSGEYWTSTGAVGPGGSTLTVRSTAIAPGVMEILGVHALAGRFFTAEHPEETTVRNAKGNFAGPVVINETALHKLHFRSAQAAIGQVLRHAPGSGSADVSQIIGVAPDVPEGSVRQAVEPTVFSSDAADFHFLAVKLAGRQVPETLSAIDALWKRIGEPRPIQRVFVDQVVQEIYVGEMRQGQMFAAFAGIALMIACLGLVGLAAFTAERRTKEIGVRKALGASRAQVVWMLVWELTRPVLWANLIAWPVGFYFMSRWLSGFAYHIDLSVWMFALSGLLAVLIAWATVSTHAWLVARARPATALRYE